MDFPPIWWLMPYALRAGPHSLLGSGQRPVLARRILPLTRRLVVMLDYGFFGRTLGPLGEAMDFVFYWLATGGRMMPPA
ncbi:hypothetical protein GS926_27465 [Rhodococcus hoagii]|nr:hypothetical protein [Prescottella equi]